MTLRERFVRRFARLTTDAVVRYPFLWRVFRPALRRIFDRLAPHWDRIRRPEGLASFEAALAALEPVPQHALDLGTGTGAGAVAIARRFPSADVVGVDVAAGMVAEAQRQLPPDLRDRVRFEQADASRLPFGDGSFELVGLANMIPFFDELDRVLAPGGVVLFGFSRGADTPIYVPPARLRAELEARGFTDFAAFAEGGTSAVLARKAGRG